MATQSLTLKVPAPLRVPMLNPDGTVGREWSGYFVANDQLLSSTGASALYLDYPGFNAGDFSSLTGSFTVDSSAVLVYSTRINGDTLELSICIKPQDSTVVGTHHSYVTGTPAVLEVKLPARNSGTYTVAEVCDYGCVVFDDSPAATLGTISFSPAFTTMSIQRADGANFTDSSGGGHYGTGFSAMLRVRVTT